MFSAGANKQLDLYKLLFKIVHFKSNSTGNTCVVNKYIAILLIQKNCYELGEWISLISFDTIIGDYRNRTIANPDNGYFVVKLHISLKRQDDQQEI